MMFNYVMGRNCIKEILLKKPQQICILFTTDIVKDKRKKELLTLAKEKEIEIRFVAKKKLTLLVGSDSHQGFVAQIKKRQTMSLHDFIGQTRRGNIHRLLVVDSIEDPQNLGALLRLAECFALDAVLFSKNRCAPISAVVAKASAGASELVPLVEVSNLAQSIKKLQEEGFVVVASEINQKAIPLKKFSFPDRAALIVGSEGKGVKALLSKYADKAVYIPLYGQIDSLNVSQATAILLYHWKEKL